MACFHNILAGVDLTHFDPATHQPDVISRAVIQRAVALAAANAARLTFVAALDITPEALSYLEEQHRQHLTQTVHEKAERMLAALVHEAQQAGVVAASKLDLGAPWRELILEVLRAKHDLLVAGTRTGHESHRMLFGSTVVKLLRRCPCPVWVAKPPVTPASAAEASQPMNVLVASDLSPVAENALRLMISLAHSVPMRIHLLHVVDYPLDHLWSTGLEDATTVAYHRAVRDEAEKQLRAQLERADYQKLPFPVEVHLLDGAGVPDQGILHFLRAHPIDLLVMGTIARGGLPGIMIGNTAERLLPEVPCSMLAIKPSGFQSPVQP